ncbi:hypothetical protein CKY28_00065 [Sphingomonas lenta]|uniref:Uncharacterized protein n=1 Tax=Sphingomonas lenta TaxID=1141887 RepID=A0A2A2SKG9_9SPHN|nr:hypothetical protein CKY28_00065 [Sphingomonas lenta]
MERLTGQPDDLLHIHAGMAVFMVARLATGRSFGSFIPFAFAVAAELVNELLDYLHGQGWTASGSAVDLVNTLFWPAVISAGVRWRPMIRRDRPAPDRPGIDDAA